VKRVLVMATIEEEIDEFCVTVGRVNSCRGDEEQTLLPLQNLISPFFSF